MLSKTKHPKKFEMLKADRQTIYRRIQKFKANGEKAFDKKSVTRDNEIRRMQKQLADIQTENEILKNNVVPCKPQSDKINFAITQLNRYSASKFCRLLKVAISNYYRSAQVDMGLIYELNFSFNAVIA